MQYRTFGRTGRQVSEIAFGAGSPGDWGPVDDAESIKTLLHAPNRESTSWTPPSCMAADTARK